MNTAQWIRERRRAAGLTQAQLAGKTGVTPGIVAQWERGIAEPGPLALANLRALLGQPAVPSAPMKDPSAPGDEAHSGRGRASRGARRKSRSGNACQPTIGNVIDQAMTAIERENSSLKGVLPNDYGRPQLDKTRLGELVDLGSTIGLGDSASRSKDILGRAYEYFLGKFAAAEGKSGGEFYTPQCVVKLLVEMIEPLRGRVFDPCCGSGGMFVSSERFVLAHGGRKEDLSIFGQESNYRGCGTGRPDLEELGEPWVWLVQRMP